MEYVYMPWHTHVDERLEGGECEKLIGVFSSNENAMAAQLRAVELPGFKYSPESFEIHKCLVDEDQWTSGFVTV